MKKYMFVNKNRWIFAVLFFLVNPVILPLTAFAGSFSSLNTQSITTNSAQVMWSSDSISDSSVYYGVASGNYTMNSNTRCDAAGLVANHCVTLNNLLPGTKYYYVAISHDTTSNSQTSSEQNFVTAAASNAGSALPALTNLVASTVSSSQVILTWTGLSGVNPSLSYRIFRNSNIIGNSSLTSYIDNNVTVGTTYTYYVDAGSNYSSPSAIISVTIPHAAVATTTPTPTPTVIPTPTPTVTVTVTPTPTVTSTPGQSSGSGNSNSDTQAPSVPNNLKFIISSAGKIYLTWTASTDNVSVAGYNIYKNGGLLTSTTATSYFDGEITSGIPYKYTVAAFDSAHNLSAQASSVDALVPLVSPTPTPTTTPNILPTPTVTPTVVVSVTPTPTVTPTSKPTPTSAPTPTIIQPASISGKVIDASGASVASVAVRFYPSSGTLTTAGLGAVTDNSGNFNLNLAPGTYKVGIDGYPSGRTDLLAPAPSTVVLVSGSNQQITLQFSAIANSKKILQGKVMFNSGEPVTDGQLGAYNPTTSQYVSAQTGSDGAYSLTLGAGNWKLSLHPLNVQTAVWQNLNDAQDISFVQDNNSQTQSLNFTVTRLQNMLTVTAVDDKGTPVQMAGITLSKTSLKDATADSSQNVTFKQTDASGTAVFLSPSGNYFVRGSVSSVANLINPTEQSVQIVDGKPTTIKLIFISPTINNTTNLTGQVALSDGTQIAGAEVWAWTDEAGSVQAKSGSDGSFSLILQSGKTWHIGAGKNINGLPYRSAEKAVDLSSTQTVNLFLIPISDTPLPAAVKVNQTSANSTLVGQASNGASVVIPSGSSSTTGTTSLQINPTVEVPTQANKYVVGAAYDINLTDQNGQNITQFTKTVQITLPYDDNDIQKLGGDVTKVVPSYFSESTGTWVKVDDFTLDTTKKIFILRVNHLTRFALVQPASVLPPTPPSNLKGVMSALNQITLTWQDPTVNFHHTRLYRKTGNGDSVLLGDLIYNGQYVDSPVATGQVYTYSLQAVDAAGNQSSFSDPITVKVTTQVPVPLQALPTSFVSGDLVNDQGAIYLIYGQTKIPFTNLAAFKGLGYQLKYVKKGDTANYQVSDNFELSSASQGHPWGSFLTLHGKRYYNYQAGIVLVPSTKIFTSNGGKTKYVLKGNAADLSLLKNSSALPALSLSDPRVQ